MDHQQPQSPSFQISSIDNTKPPTHQILTQRSTSKKSKIVNYQWNEEAGTSSEAPPWMGWGLPQALTDPGTGITKPITEPKIIHLLIERFYREPSHNAIIAWRTEVSELISNLSSRPRHLLNHSFSPSRFSQDFNMLNPLPFRIICYIPSVSVGQPILQNWS